MYFIIITDIITKCDRYYYKMRQLIYYKIRHKFTLDFFTSNLGFCLKLGLLNSETEIGTGVA